MGRKKPAGRSDAEAVSKSHKKKAGGAPFALPLRVINWDSRAEIRDAEHRHIAWVGHAEEGRAIPSKQTSARARAIVDAVNALFSSLDK